MLKTLQYKGFTGIANTKDVTYEILIVELKSDRITKGARIHASLKRDDLFNDFCRTVDNYIERNFKPSVCREINKEQISKTNLIGSIKQKEKAIKRKNRVIARLTKKVAELTKKDARLEPVLGGLYRHFEETSINKGKYDEMTVLSFDETHVVYIPSDFTVFIASKHQKANIKGSIVAHILLSTREDFNDWYELI